MTAKNNNSFDAQAAYENLAANIAIMSQAIAALAQNQQNQVIQPAPATQPVQVIVQGPAAPKNVTGNTPFSARRQADRSEQLAQREARWVAKQNSVFAAPMECSTEMGVEYPVIFVRNGQEIRMTVTFSPEKMVLVAEDGSRREYRPDEKASDGEWFPYLGFRDAIHRLKTAGIGNSHQLHGAFLKIDQVVFGGNTNNPLNI